MKNINPYILFPFCYQTDDQETGLFVRALIYNVTTGSPVYESAVQMIGTSDGLYSGGFVSTASQSYFVIGLVYTDDTYMEIDETRSPWVECYKCTDAPLDLILMNYGAFDQNSSMLVAANIYDILTGSPVLVSQVPFIEVFAGTYFGSYIGIIGASYVVNTSVYTDDTYTEVDNDRPSGSDALQLSTASAILNITTPLTLTGQNAPALLESTMIYFTQGDGPININLTASLGDGTPVDLTGATFSTQMRGVGNTIVTFANSQHTANPDQVNHKGQFILTLQSIDTPTIGVGFNKNIVTQITIDGATVAYRGNCEVTVFPTPPLP